MKKFTKFVFWRIKEFPFVSGAPLLSSQVLALGNNGEIHIYSKEDLFVSGKARIKPLYVCGVKEGQLIAHDLEALAYQFGSVNLAVSLGFKARLLAIAPWSVVN